VGLTQRHGRLEPYGCGLLALRSATDQMALRRFRHRRSTVRTAAALTFDQIRLAYKKPLTTEGARPRRREESAHMSIVTTAHG
jgi:hypothetical protein